MTLRFRTALGVLWSCVSAVVGDLSGDLLAAAVGLSYGGTDLSTHWRNTVPNTTDACTWLFVTCQGQPQQNNFSFAIRLENQGVTGKQCQSKHPECTNRRQVPHTTTVCRHPQCHLVEHAQCCSAHILEPFRQPSVWDSA